MISKDFCNTLQSTQTWTTTAMTKNNISHKHIRFPAGSLNLNIDFPPLLFASALSVHRKQKDKIFLFKNREKQAARFSHDQRIANGRNCDLYTKQFRSCRSEHIVCCTHSSFPVDHRCAAYISALYHHDILLYVLRQSCNADDGKKSIISGKKTFLILMMRLRKWMIMSAGSYGSFFLVSTKKAWHRNDLMLREMLFVQASPSCNVCLTRSKSG